MVRDAVGPRRVPVAAAALLLLAVHAGLIPAAAGANSDATVPAVVDVRLDMAIRALKKAGLAASHHDDVKDRARRMKSRWVVINQDPPAGTVVASGTRVRLGVRHRDDLAWPGQAPVAVPDVVGVRFDRARKALRTAHLRASSFDAVRTDRPRKQRNGKSWIVVVQEPPAGTTVAGGSHLRLGVRHRKDRVEPPAPPAPVTAPSTTAVPALPLAAPAGDEATVAKVIDGDTIEVEGGRRVRFIGIDTPEVSGGVECYGREASARTAELLPVGTRVRLEYDVERTDRYGRTLAYVHRVSDGLFVNLDLARSGFAQQLTVPPNVAHAEEIRQAVAEARSATRALWSACPAAGPPAPATTASPSAPARPATTAAAASTGGCHPSYRGACVPIAEDVDCAGGTGNGPAYVAQKDIQVVGPDEYGLDADNDGIGCEARR